MIQQVNTAAAEPATARPKPRRRDDRALTSAMLITRANTVDTAAPAEIIVRYVSPTNTHFLAAHVVDRKSVSTNWKTSGTDHVAIRHGSELTLLAVSMGCTSVPADREVDRMIASVNIQACSASFKLEGLTGGERLDSAA
jgi:hypothetical protein